MNKLPAFLWILLPLIGLTSLAISDSRPNPEPYPEETAVFMDKLTDELLYVVELASRAQNKVIHDHYQELASEVSSSYLANNRDLCKLIIDRRIPAKRELYQRHRQSLFSMSADFQDVPGQKFHQLLEEEFMVIDSLAELQKMNVKDPDVLNFVRQLLQTQDEFKSRMDLYKERHQLLSRK